MTAADGHIDTHLLLITKECMGFWTDRSEIVNKSIKKTNEKNKKGLETYRSRLHVRKEEERSSIIVLSCHQSLRMQNRVRNRIKII